MTQFHALFLEKCVPRTLRDDKKDEFMAIEQGSMYVASYEAKFHALSRICYIIGYQGRGEDTIVHYGLDSELQVIYVHMTST